MKAKILIGKLVLASLVVTSFTGCSNNDTTVQNPPANSIESDSVETQESEVKSAALSFKEDNYTLEQITVDGQEVIYRAYENIVYVENPVDAEYQSMNIYIPEAYYNGESIGNFTAETAPIFLPNTIGGYMPALPGIPSMEGAIDGEASRVGLTSNGEASEESPNALLMALSKGYIVASPGARGRTSEAEDGTYTGKAPAAIVDLKAAVRYLHYNDEMMPGTAEKIISSGTSAGGGLSSLLGATGNHADYESYLEELGAADASDAIYAVSAYCPITNLENADMGYEWLFNGINNYTSMVISRDENGEIKRKKVDNVLTEAQIAYSNELKQAFPAYINSLNLKDENGNALTLDENGNGTFKDYVKTIVIQSAQEAIDSGQDLADISWVTIENGTVVDVEFNDYIEYLSRSKAVPAFDSVELAAPENNLFGTESLEAQHFTAFSFERDTNNGTMATAEIIKMMNPMYYIGTEGTETAQYWRIRHGAKDSDTAISTPTILALTLEANGSMVDFAVPWGQGHGGDYDLEELFTWMDSISN